MTELSEQAEELLRLRQKTQNNSLAMFHTKGSAGRNPVKLAQICSTWDMVMDILGWQDRPLGHLTNFLTQYQASIDAKYHNDYKDVLIAEEIERRRSERKGISILQNK